MKNMKPKPQVEKRIDGLSGKEYTAGTGIEIKDKEINLKQAQMGYYFDNGFNGSEDYRGGIFIDKALFGSRDGLYIDWHGALKLLPADGGIERDGRIQGATGYGGVSIGKGIATTTRGHISVNLGDGMRFNRPPEGVGYNETNWSISPKNGDGLIFNAEDAALRLNLGGGLEFTERVYDEEEDEDYEHEKEEPRYTSMVRIKIGEGLKFGANGELIATGGKEYKAGENITISADGTISADVKEYTAGENITISSDGKISATGGGAELVSGGGITIETDEETGKQTVSALVGEGAEIRDGKICTVPNIENAVIIKEADAKYLLHNFTEIEYNAGVAMGYAGPLNQIILQGLICYKSNGIAPNGATVISKQNVTDAAMIPDVPIYTEMNFDPPAQYGGFKLVKLKAQLTTVSTNSYMYKIDGVKEDGSEINIVQNLSNYDNYDTGFTFVWNTIYAPNSTYEFGYVAALIFVKQKTGTAQYSFINRANITVPFASLAEYQAAVGLTYEPLTLTRVEDSPTVVSGKNIGEGVT